MNQIGPPLEAMMRRLAETPEAFLDEPMIGDAGRVSVPALVNDLLAGFGKHATPETLVSFISSDARADRNRLALVMITVWMLSDEWFAKAETDERIIRKLLTSGLADLAAATAAHNYISDPDRREELARTVLTRLELRPHGETMQQAQDRLTSISGIERKRLIAASRDAEKRAREVREALARKAAQESADKWSRE